MVHVLLLSTDHGPYCVCCASCDRVELESSSIWCEVSAGCNRVKSYHQRSAQYDQILKKNEQMYALLAITTSLCPASNRNCDESVTNMLKEK